MTNTCPAHFATYDENGDCQWCRAALGVPLKRAPWLLTADDILLLQSALIDPELKAPSDFQSDTGGD